jgi:hypothetical protein
LAAPSTGLVYGLVGVRADEQHILCAALDVKGADLDVRLFRAGVHV